MIGKGVIIISLVLLFLVVPMIYAEQTVKTIEIPLGYNTLVNPNVIQQYNFTVDFPDGISKILSLEFLINADYLAGTKTYGGVIVNKVPVLCDPSEWTTYFDGREKISFDCSELIKQTGWTGNPTIPLEFTFMADNFIGNVKPKVKMTYYNKPKISAQVHGTEYVSNEDGKIFIQLLDETDQPINDTTCFASIYYPNNTFWKYQQSMEYVDEGIYIYDFTTLDTFGVYPVSALCTIPAIASSNHTAEDDFNSGSISGGSGWSSNWNIDSCYYESVNVHEGNYSIECSNDRNPRRTISSNNSYTSIDYDFWWRGDSLEASDFVYYTLTDASGVNHTLLTISDGDDDGNFHREMGTLYDDIDSFDFNGTITFQILTSNSLGNGDYYNLDTLEIILKSPEQANSSAYEEVRGSGELHLSQEINLSNINVSVSINSTQIADTIWQYNDTINPNLLSQFASSIWSFTNRTLTSFGSLINNIWNFEPRNVTVTNDLTNYSHIEQLINESNINYTQISEGVWNYTNRTVGTDSLWIGGTEYSPDEETGKIVVRLVDSTNNPVENADCNLTIFYPNNTKYLTMVMTEYQPPANVTGVGGVYLADFNHSGEIGVHPYGVDCYKTGGASPKRYFLLDTYHVYGANYTAQAESIWNYDDRSLTEFNLTVNATLVFNESDIARLVWNWKPRNLTYYGDVNSNLTKNIENFALTFIGETEYLPSDDGLVSIRLVRGTGELTELELNASCNLSILYPNRTYWLENVTMTEFGIGIYNYNFTVPDTYGVYTYAPDCAVGSPSRKYYGLETFHVYENVWDYEARYIHGEILT